jgi:hypothetical protein
MGNVAFFFSRQRVVSQSEGSTNPIELAHAHADIEALQDQMLKHGTREGGSSLTTLYEKGSYFTTKLDRVTLPPIIVTCLPLGSYSLEEPIDGCAMHGNFALIPRLLD